MFRCPDTDLLLWSTLTALIVSFSVVSVKKLSKHTVYYLLSNKTADKQGYRLAAKLSDGFSSEAPDISLRIWRRPKIKLQESVLT